MEGAPPPLPKKEVHLSAFVTLLAGTRVRPLGLGTWRMGEDPRRRQEEIATIRLALDLGLSLIDTAEMYGEGVTESLIGEAIRGRRDDAFLVDKVLPSNATRKGTIAACGKSLVRLGTDRIDLYLLHWRGDHPLDETVRGFADLMAAGKIRSWGVSNFDVSDMEDLAKVSDGSGCASNQVLFNLSRRGAERDLLPWLRARHIPLMAYSPIEQARLLRNRKLVAFARRHGMTAAQAALSWLLSRDGVVPIPKTSSRERLRENAGALARPLTSVELHDLDRAFPPPAGRVPLEML